jgi:hypothetical protein
MYRMCLCEEGGDFTSVFSNVVFYRLFVFYMDILQQCGRLFCMCRCASGEPEAGPGAGVSDPGGGDRHLPGLLRAGQPTPLQDTLATQCRFSPPPWPDYIQNSAATWPVKTAIKNLPFAASGKKGIYFLYLSLLAFLLKLGQHSNVKLYIKSDKAQSSYGVVPVRDGHGGGWSRKINARYLHTLMVYL